MLAASLPIAASEPPMIGWTALTRLDRLAEYRPVVEVGSVSSYDRTGGNDDGFSGTHSFIRKEANGLVIADLEGPGVIYRIWTPTPTDDLMEFTFDGEQEPRLRVGFREIFLGHTQPFVKPLVGYGVGGFFSYVPLPFAKSCKVVVRAERVQFYQINYARYQSDAGIRTFTRAADAGTEKQMTLATELFALSGHDISRFTAPPNSQTHTARKQVTVPAGGSATVYETNRGGRIVGLRLSPPALLARKPRDLVLKMVFDRSEASVLCPVGDFFGYAWGAPATRALLIGSTEQAAYCYYPMPFSHSARIELVSENPDAKPMAIAAEVIVTDVPRRSNEGTFGATWRRENPTRIGHPFTFIEMDNRGHLAGFVLQAQGFESGKTLFFEGDDVTRLDGRQAVHGTGSEDFFNGGWYDVPDRWEKPLNFALSGCLGYQKHLGRTGGYRLLLGDAYSFNKSALQTIEHAGTGNEFPTDYAGVTYFYSEQPVAAALPDVAKRAVVDLEELVFPAWWQIPIRAFPLQGTTLTRKSIKIGDEDVRYLSLRGGTADWVGPPYLYVTCHVPNAGRYAVFIEAVRGPEAARLQLFQDEVPVGKPADLFAEAPQKSGRIHLGYLELAQGDNPLMLKLVGKHVQSVAVGLDLIQITLQRAPEQSRQP
jgi:hypothetical protein